VRALKLGRFMMVDGANGRFDRAKLRRRIGKGAEDDGLRFVVVLHGPISLRVIEAKGQANRVVVGFKNDELGIAYKFGRTGIRLFVTNID